MQQNEIRREMMPYEEFVILCAKIYKENERKFIVDPINLLDAKCILTKKIEKKVDFFEFCVNHFLQAHHHISKCYLLENINKKLNLIDISFDLYDTLIEKFFIECQSNSTGYTIQTIFEIQAKLFYKLYEEDFWKQLFVCKDCSTYLFKYPEPQVLGFLKSLFNYTRDKKGMDEFIKKMNSDGVIDIIIKYLYENTLKGSKSSINTLTEIIEILDFSIITKSSLFTLLDNFLDTISEKSMNSVAILTALFSNLKISNEQVDDFINIIEEKNFFGYFIDYLNNQIKLNDNNDISHFSDLLYTIFYPLIPQNLCCNDKILNLFTTFRPIFYQTLANINKLTDEYSKFIFSLLQIQPDDRGSVLNVLTGKINTLLTNSQTDYNSSIIISNYLNLFLKIQSSQLQENSNEIDHKAVFIQLFQLLETGPNNLIRTELFLDVLAEIIDLRKYLSSNIIDVCYFDKSDSNSSPKPNKSYNHDPSTVNLLSAAVFYYKFILNDDFTIENIGEELFIRLVTLYSAFVFEWTKTTESNQYDEYIARLFTIAIRQMRALKGIIYRCIKKFYMSIQKVTDLRSIALNLMTSLDNCLICSGLKIVNIMLHKTLMITEYQKNEVVIQSIQITMKKIAESGLNVQFDDIMPLFMSTSISSINNTNPNGMKLDQQTVASIHDFMLALRNQNENYDDNWLNAFLHFFGFIFLSDIKDIYDPIAQLFENNKGENEEDDNSDFDFKKVTFIARELKNEIPADAEFDDQITFINNILIYSTNKCTRVINEYLQDEGVKLFNSGKYMNYYPIPLNINEAFEFAGDAAEYFVSLLSKFRIITIYQIILPFFKMCCSIPIIKKEETLFSIFQFISENDPASIDEFIQCSLKMLEIVQNNSEEYLANIYALAEFHLLLIRNNRQIIDVLKNQLDEEYLAILFNYADDSNLDFFKKDVKMYFYRRRY